MVVHRFGFDHDDEVVSALDRRIASFMKVLHEPCEQSHMLVHPIMHSPGGLLPSRAAGILTRLVDLLNHRRGGFYGEMSHTVYILVNWCKHWWIVQSAITEQHLLCTTAPLEEQRDLCRQLAVDPLSFILRTGGDRW